MSDWPQIMYRDFWDVPRMVVARRGDDMFLFYSRFDESSDCHTDYYEVLVLPLLSEQQLQGSWDDLEGLALDRRPNIGLQDLLFEVPRRGVHT